MTKSMNRSFLFVAAGVALFLAGCTDVTSVVEPDRQAPVAAPKSTPQDVWSFPDLQRPGQIFVAPPGLYDRGFSEMHGGPLISRYVLYEDGSFSLQFLSIRFGFFEYAGRRTTDNGHLWFSFFDDARWDARATLEAGKLSVRYNVIMMLSDFVDGVYSLAP